MDLKNKLIAFMYGRYGTDALSYFMWAISIVLSFSVLFIPGFIIKLIIQLVSATILVLVFLRIFSRNLTARRSENTKFLRLTKPITSFFKLTFNRFKYRKTHVYRKCPHCKNTLRLPKVKGKHGVKCPACKKSFDVNI